MALVDILRRTAPVGMAGMIVVAKPHGWKWGKEELNEERGWVIETVETDLSIKEIKNKYRVDDGELKLAPSEMWVESIRAARDEELPSG